MLKVIDVDLIADFTLELTFSDGYTGEANLAEYFQKEAFSHVTNFQKFALTADGSLDWSGVELSAATLKEITVGSYTESDLTPFDVKEMEMVIKQASWDSMQEGRADILQAAIRSYVEQFGHSVVIERAGIKSRTSAYRSLKPETTPSFGTLVQLGHAVIELAKDRVSAHSLSRM
ncbi:DUF2442 domain-containing protein [Pseudoalteromonas sp. TAB23]|uniref:type II toxin-antitoxin system antitoxin DhiA n=1 Tax=Pseudoalteromonas sp. TAB23 TaxID=1938595 RepID=UPI0003FC66EF|nr:DUF2442 domain-containing protein [Pseudoalteromonas sp. TAB23]